MKLTCEKTSLAEAINTVSKAVSTRTTLPILECILINVYNDEITLTASDLDIGIKTAPIKANVSETGAFAIEARLFSEIIRKLNGDNVTIETNSDGKTAVIKCGYSEFTVMIQNPDDFPPLQEVEKDFSYKIKQVDLKNMINQTIFSVAMDESKPVLTGELMEIKNNSTNIVAVDGFRISCRRAETPEIEKPVNVIIPAKTMREISRILSDSDEYTEIFITDKHVLFIVNGNTVVSRVIDGDYIKYEQTFTDEFGTKIVVSKNELISALERASLISRDARKMPVKFEISEGKIIITSQTEMGKAHEEVDCTFEGSELKIAFNPRFLIEALKSVEDDDVSIQFNSSLSPCIIKPEEGDKYKYLILPLRV